MMDPTLQAEHFLDSHSHYSTIGCVAELAPELAIGFLNVIVEGRLMRRPFTLNHILMPFELELEIIEPKEFEACRRAICRQLKLDKLVSSITGRAWLLL